MKAIRQTVLGYGDDPILGFSTYVETVWDDGSTTWEASSELGTRYLDQRPSIAAHQTAAAVDARLLARKDVAPS